MRVALIARNTLYAVPGGDTVQIVQTARQLAQLGVQADVKLSGSAISYTDYDLLHFFNLTRPADILYHSSVSGKPYVISTILIDYSEYDKHHRAGIAGLLLRYFSSDAIEYIKTMARAAAGKDRWAGLDYLWRGQRTSITKILAGAATLLPNSVSEYDRSVARYGHACKYTIVPNGINPHLFTDKHTAKDNNLVICVARIEGIKNQLSLIKALNNTRFSLFLIGAHAPNQANYYRACRAAAASNIKFIAHTPQSDLIRYYQTAKVHVLPSWFETTGLSSLEAAAMGCNVVITDKGDAGSYFKKYAFYCDPASVQSIYSAIEQAALAGYNEQLRKRILNNYTWQKAAKQTLKAYRQAISRS